MDVWQFERDMKGLSEHLAEMDAPLIEEQKKEHGRNDDD